MPLTPETTRYIADVADHLSHLPRPVRAEALADLSDLLASGVTPGELGSPAHYAAALALAPTAPNRDTPRSTPRLLGVPFAASRSPLWNPGDPHLLLPRRFGLGWTLNLGAVAVKLGWLRPDDADLDVLSAAPLAAWVGSSLIPAACEAVTLGACITAWRRAVDGQLPANAGSDGRPNFWADRRLVLGVIYAVAAASTAVGVTTRLPGERSTFDAVTGAGPHHVPFDGERPSPDGDRSSFSSHAPTGTVPDPAAQVDTATEQDSTTHEDPTATLPTDPAARAEWESDADRALSRLVTASLTGGTAAVAAVWVARSARNPDRLRLGTVPAAIGIPAAAGLAAALLPIRTGLARVGRGRVR